MDAIEHAKGFIRFEMCKHINLRVAPELLFNLAETLVEAARMEALIDKTLADDEKRRRELGVSEDTNEEE